MAKWHVAPLRLAPAFRALGVCKHSWLRYNNYSDRICRDHTYIIGTTLSREKLLGTTLSQEYRMTYVLYYLIKTVAQYTNKYFQKSLVGVIILREEVEKDLALNTAELFPSWRRLKTSTITVVSIPWTLSVASTEARTTVSLAASVRAFFRATDYSNKTLKHLRVLELI